MSAKPRVLTLADKTASAALTLVVDSKTIFLVTWKKVSSSKSQTLKMSVSNSKTHVLKDLAPNTKYQVTAVPITTGSKSAGLKIFFYTKALPKANASKSPSSSKPKAPKPSPPIKPEKK